MKKALTFIAFAGIFSALLMTTGCTKKGDCTSCGQKDVKLTKVKVKMQACRKCIDSLERELKSDAKEDDNFCYDISDSEKTGQVCDSCHETNKKVRIVTIEGYSCKYDAKINKKVFQKMEILRELAKEKAKDKEKDKKDKKKKRK